MSNLIINGIDHSQFDIEWAKRGGVVLATNLHVSSVEYLGSYINGHNYTLILKRKINQNAEWVDYYEKMHNEYAIVSRMATPAECAAAGIEYIEPPMMSETQKQGIADLKIKAANGIVGGKTLASRLTEITPQAHESVQNGTCDD